MLTRGSSAEPYVDLLRAIGPKIRDLFIDPEGYTDAELDIIIASLSPGRLEVVEVGCPSPEFMAAFLKRSWPALKHIGFVPSADTIVGLASRTGSLESVGIWSARLDTKETKLAIKAIHVLIDANPRLLKVCLESASYYSSGDSDSDGEISGPEESELEAPLVVSPMTSGYHLLNAGIRWLHVLIPRYSRLIHRLPKRWEKKFHFPLARVRFAGDATVWEKIMEQDFRNIDRARTEAVYKACCAGLASHEQFRTLVAGGNRFLYGDGPRGSDQRYQSIILLCEELLDPLWDAHYIMERFYHDDQVWTALSLAILTALLRTRGIDERVRTWFDRCKQVLADVENLQTTIRIAWAGLGSLGDQVAVIYDPKMRDLDPVYFDSMRLASLFTRAEQDKM